MDSTTTEFITVRVQDPRLQNEGSWSSYVDFKIFLHVSRCLAAWKCLALVGWRNWLFVPQTNSKAFTAKTSCVRRRYSEFVWLKKKLQKNVGLVEDFLEKRRKGLQSFLDRVLNMTVCLSDSQLHLFLQTQLPIGHIQDCVQGLTPYTVTDAILTYASSNRGWAQEEGGGLQDPGSVPPPYESVGSPALPLPPQRKASSPSLDDAKELEAQSGNSVSLSEVYISAVVELLPADKTRPEVGSTENRTQDECGNDVWSEVRLLEDSTEHSSARESQSSPVRLQNGCSKGTSGHVHYVEASSPVVLNGDACEEMNVHLVYNCRPDDSGHLQVSQEM
ncbi:sorting nexin-11 isoform X2 [Denticeps clupeoides]|uniref:sorting nexin-11 isoform X2 n=1 Tax=Denticeps clupeoides TaxID=299321 RepID=UPI0010A4155C|nr:sorting nexin-11-like isoform X2 [Denticeps clupeoides]